MTKLSLRSRRKPIRQAVEEAASKLEAEGGGHEYECGANIKTEDLERFLERFKKELEGQSEQWK